MLCVEKMWSEICTAFHRRRNDSKFAVLTATPSWEMGTSPCFIAETLQKKEMITTHKFKASEILGALYLNFLISLLSFSVINYAVCEIKIKWIFKLLKWPSPKCLESGLRHRPNLWLSPFVSQPRNPCSGSPHMPWSVKNTIVDLPFYWVIGIF